MNKIEIETVLNGWIVTVGCQRVVFDNMTMLLDALMDYLDDPKAVEEKWLESSINSEHVRKTISVDMGNGLPAPVYGSGLRNVTIP